MGVDLRRIRPKKIVLFSVITLIVVCASLFAVFKHKTIYYIFNADKIKINSAAQCADALSFGMSESGTFRYYKMDGALYIEADYSGGIITEMRASIDINKVNISAVSEGVKQANEVIAPYFNNAEKDAIVWLVLNKIVLPYCMYSEFSVTESIGVFDFDVSLNQNTDSIVRIKVMNNEEAIGR